MKKYGGFYICITLFLILSFLKLTGVINFSWWYVCTPLYIIVAALVLFIAYALIVLYDITKNK